jgi:hypothetical protein
VISNRTIREWVRNQINDDGTLDMADFAWENRQFDSSDKSIYFVERMVVTAERPSTNQESVKWGMTFYDVIVDRDAGTEDQEDNAKILADIFQPADNKDVVIESGLKIDIDEATTGSRTPYGESRTQLPVRIEWRAYETTS